MDTTKAAARPPLRVLTALRFAAAAEVVIGHYFSFDQTDFLHNLLSAGRQAVTFFFVLSGFILTYVYSDPVRPSRISVDNRDFWKARGARILPVYWFGLLISAPLLIYGTFVSRISPLDRTIEGLILTPVLLQAWAPPVAEIWNPPGWSLSVEALFYAVFPWVARLAFRIRIRWLFAAALVSAIAADLVAQAITRGPAPTTDAYLFAWHFPLLSLPQFLFGVAAGRLHLARGPLPQRQSLCLFAAASAAVILVVGAAPRLGPASGSAI